MTKTNSPNIQKIGQDALKLARQGNIVWIFLKDKERKKIRHHSNIYVYSLPRLFFNLVSLWKILKRQKKFDKIFVDDESYKNRLNNFKPFHKAEVIYVR